MQNNKLDLVNNNLRVLEWKYKRIKLLVVCLALLSGILVTSAFISFQEQASIQRASRYDLISNEGTFSARLGYVEGGTPRLTIGGTDNNIVTIVEPQFVSVMHRPTRTNIQIGIMGLERGDASLSIESEKVEIGINSTATGSLLFMRSKDNKAEIKLGFNDAGPFFRILNNDGSTLVEYK